jgi:tRNA (guanine-N7-)-methyltransferase
LPEYPKESQESAPKERLLFGRKKGKTLSLIRAQALDANLATLQIPKNLLPQDHSHQPADFFGRTFAENWLEIGFGCGEHLSALMRRHPDTGFLGAEPFINGMSAFLVDISDDPKDNIRVLMNDGMIIAGSLAPQCLDGIYILNPDPWHKKRHHKRRIINQGNLDVFARILKPHGQLVMSTDVPYLADWMVTQATLHPAFEWTAKSAADWQTPPDGWIPTRYEVKGAKGAKKMVYLIFRKKT